MPPEGHPLRVKLEWHIIIETKLLLKVLNNVISSRPLALIVSMLDYTK